MHRSPANLLSPSDPNPNSYLPCHPPQQIFPPICYDCAKLPLILNHGEDGIVLLHSVDRCKVHNQLGGYETVFLTNHIDSWLKLRPATTTTQ